MSKRKRAPNINKDKFDLAIELHKVHGFTRAKIANMMGYAPGTVGRWLKSGTWEIYNNYLTSLSESQIKTPADSKKSEDPVNLSLLQAYVNYITEKWEFIPRPVKYKLIHRLVLCEYIEDLNRYNIPPNELTIVKEGEL